MAKDILPSTHPLTPPRSEEVRLDWLRLLRSRRVGPTTFYRLMGEHGTAKAALAALPEVARAAGVEKYQPCSVDLAQEELRAGHVAGAHLVAFGDDDYPSVLKDLPDAPPILWMLGNRALLQRPSVALVGARNASSLGTRMARRMAQDLGTAGYVVTSGLARCVDAAAHLAALPTGTCAVMAGGVDVIYPAENAVLAQEIAETGLRLSEQPMHQTPTARHFPTRNRIISGLSAAVVVIEAAGKSGSLITARNALDQGREVLAVPGHPFDARASGCNMLLRDGAILVRHAADVIDALGAISEDRTSAPTPEIPRAQPERRNLAETSALHSQILSRLGPSPVAEDQLIRDLGVPAASISPELVSLELEGKITRKNGGLLALAS